LSFTTSDILHVNSDDQLAFTVFPNPVVSGILYFTNSKLNGLQFNIYNQLGKLEQKGILTNNAIDIKDLLSGFYYIYISNKMFKVIKY
jgi:hypothetical protein